MRTLRGRFILSHILPVLIVVLVVGFALIYLLETQVLLKELSDGLTEEANLIAESLNSQQDLWNNSVQTQQFLGRISLYIDRNIFLLGPEGEFLASNNPLFSEQFDLPQDFEGIETATEGNQSVVITYGLFQPSGEVLVPVFDIEQELVGIVGVTHKLDEVSAEFIRLRRFITLALLFSLTLGVVLGIVLAQRLEKPIGRAATAVIHIAEGERIDLIPEEGPTEIRHLSRSVNILSERLRILEDTRRRLLANLVHEIGRPLGAIRSAIHVLRTGASEDPETREELLAGVEKEVERMQPLLDDLAQLHGQVLGTLELDRKPIALSDWLPPLLLPGALQPWRKNWIGIRRYLRIYQR